MTRVDNLDTLFLYCSTGFSTVHPVYYIKAKLKQVMLQLTAHIHVLIVLTVECDADAFL